MQYGAMNHPLHPVLDQIPGFARMGFDYLELTLDAPKAHYSVIRQQADAISQALEHHDMGLVCHLPTFVYTADLTPGIRQASVAEMVESVAVAARLGAKKAVVHPGMLIGLGHQAKARCLQYAMESLHTIASSARVHDLKLCAENMPPACGIFCEPEDFDSLFEVFPQFGLTLDTGHAHVQLKDHPRPARLAEFIARFSHRIAHVHASDNQGKKDEHLALGKGTIDFEDLVSRLKAVEYAGTVTLEIFSEDPADLPASQDHLAGLWEKIAPKA